MGCNAFQDSSLGFSFLSFLLRQISAGRKEFQFQSRGDDLSSYRPRFISVSIFPNNVNTDNNEITIKSCC